jgi:hypothetical protein
MDETFRRHMEQAFPKTPTAPAEIDPEGALTRIKAITAMPLSTDREGRPQPNPKGRATQILTGKRY